MPRVIHKKIKEKDVTTVAARCSFSPVLFTVHIAVVSFSKSLLHNQGRCVRKWSFFQVVLSKEFCCKPSFAITFHSYSNVTRGAGRAYRHSKSEVTIMFVNLTCSLQCTFHRCNHYHLSTVLSTSTSKETPLYTHCPF